ncbi:MAG: hypothetical protein EU550_02830, partial [Promethearchaeota archaeon]
MDEGIMIDGIKRKTTAIEGTRRYFQTIDLIISHLKRDADKSKIFELLPAEENTLNDLLIGTAAVHIYHNLGMRVKDSLELGQISSDSTHKLELLEKKKFFEEINSLLKDSLRLEINMLYKKIELENRILNHALEIRVNKLQDFQKEKKIKEIGDQIENDLMEIIRKYPPFYFYDLIGDLIGLTNETKFEILEESSALKDLSVEIEKKLDGEEKEDKVIELSTLNRLMKKIQNEFEFKSYTELQVQAMPVRMLKRRIIEYNLNKCPISIFGLKSYIQANETKKELIGLMENALTENINYDSFEGELLNFLKEKYIEQLNKNPNDFVYYLQNLNESSFNEIVYQLNKNGIYNLLDITKIDEEISEKIKKYMIRYNIDKFDFISLKDEKKNLILAAKRSICKMPFSLISDITKSCNDLEDFDLYEILKRNNDKNSKIWKILEENLNMDINELREHIRKKEIIDKFFLKELNLSSYSQVLTLLEFEDIMSNLVKETYYFIFSKILRQLSRVIESYLKISNEKALYLLTLKKIHGTT